MVDVVVEDLDVAELVERDRLGVVAAVRAASSYIWHHLSVPQSKTWPCSRSHIVKPAGAVRVKQAMPFTPQVAPAP